MNPLEAASVTCPWCGEPHEMIIDCTAGNQQLVEDCSVCCRPILCSIDLDGDSPRLTVLRENE